ncbi:uncharacterized protein KZ484_018645 [Pholidichthys leucotaenia]
MAEEEEWIDRERKKFNITRIPTVKLQRLVILEPHDWKEDEEDDFTGQQLCKQERDSSLNQEDQKVSRVREEEEEQLDLKQEADAFMVTPSYEENNQGQSVPNREHLLPHSALKRESQHPGADVPQLHDYKEEVLTLQQFCNQQERNFSLDQEEQQDTQIKGEDEEQLGLKQETDSFMVTPTYEKNDQSQPEPNREQLFFHNSPEIEIQNQKAGNHVKPGSSNNKKLKPWKGVHRNGKHRKDVNNCMSENQFKKHTGEKSVNCAASDKELMNGSVQKNQVRTSTCKNAWTCPMKSRTKEKRYPCETWENF